MKKITHKNYKRGGNKITRHIKYKMREDNKMNKILLVLYGIIELLGIDMDKELTNKINQAIKEEKCANNGELSETEFIGNVLNRVYKIKFLDKYENYDEYYFL